MESQHKKQQNTFKSFFTNDKQRYTFYFDLSPNQNPYKLDVYLQARTIMEDALLQAIDQINQIIRKDHIQLISDVRLYKARLVGRNFKPKMDLPCLSLYQKICDLKIQQIAVQILNREKAIRQINQQIQISKQNSQARIQSKEVETQKETIQQETNKIKQQNAANKQQNKQIVVNQQKNEIEQKQVQNKQEQNKPKVESLEDTKVVNADAIETKEFLRQTKESIVQQPIEQIPLTNQSADQARDFSQQSKPKEQQPQKKEPVQQVKIDIDYNKKIEQQSSKIIPSNNAAQDNRISNLLKQLIERRQELISLRKEVDEQKKDIREQRRDLRQQRSEVRQMRKQLSQQRARLQLQRKELSELTKKLQQQRKQWQSLIKKGKN